MVTRLLLSDGGIIYPNFLSAEDRKLLRERLQTGSLTMRCSCRNDMELLYGLSVDCRIIPLHKLYEHAAWCSRYQGDRRMTAAVYDEEGNTTVFLKFNPQNFTLPKVKERETVEVSPDNEKDDNTSSINPDVAGRKKEKSPVYSLRQMIRSINKDTYTERIMMGKQVLLSEDYFRTALMARLKKVYIYGMDRSLRNLSLEDNQMSFFYGKLEKIEESILYLRGGNGVYRRFVLDSVLLKAEEDFVAIYGSSLEECMSLSECSVYAAGFVYKRISRMGKAYTCVGRLCFFIVSQNGIYVDSIMEGDTINALLQYTRKCGGIFLFPDSEEAPYYGIFRIPNQRKEGYIYLNTNKVDNVNAVNLCLKEVPGTGELEEFVNNICFKQ